MRSYPIKLILALACIWPAQRAYSVTVETWKEEDPGAFEKGKCERTVISSLGRVLLGRDEHIAIHLATKRLPAAARRGVAALGNLAIVAFHVYLLILSFRWIAVAGANMAEELKFPLRYIQIALPIGCGLAALYALNNAFDALFDRDWGKERPE